MQYVLFYFFISNTICKYNVKIVTVLYENALL